MTDNNIDHIYSTILTERGFSPIEQSAHFNSCGQTYHLSDDLGGGYYWIYSNTDLYDIKIHDFYYKKDTLYEGNLPESMSICYYQSISGHELSPYRCLNANCIRTHIGGHPYKAIIHKKVPIRTVDIEIFPAYYLRYLKEKFPADYINPYKAFCSIDETTHFPQMQLLLKQILDYRGTGISAKLFYEAKVNEAVSLVVERLHDNKGNCLQLSEDDRMQIGTVTAFIHDHATETLTLNQLSKIACMGTTKLKQSFKEINKCTITEYIQQTRITQAEFLLSKTSMSIAQISKAVGYANPSRFTELFSRYIGILPMEYRKMISL